MLNSSQLEFIDRTLGRKLTNEEVTYLHGNHGPDIGFIDFDERPTENRKQLVLYTACTGVQIRHYLKQHRPEVFNEYQITHVIAHGLSLRSAEPGFKLHDIVPAMFKIADALIYNPVDAAHEGLSHVTILRSLKPECKTASFGGPHHGCWWLICPFFGEEPVWAYLDQGLTPDQIWGKVQDKSFDPLFKDRFTQQMAFMKGYQHATDVRLTEFISQNYKKCKLFFTFNHPSCHVLAFLTDECLGQMGFARLGQDHAVYQVAADEKMVGDVYPETDFEWQYYGLEYPQRWADRMGGLQFYRERIDEIHKKWLDKKK
jgi:hypothetical protein